MFASVHSQTENLDLSHTARRLSNQNNPAPACSPVCCRFDFYLHFLEAGVNWVLLRSVSARKTAGLPFAGFRPLSKKKLTLLLRSGH